MNHPLRLPLMYALFIPTVRQRCWMARLCAALLVVFVLSACQSAPKKPKGSGGQGALSGGVLVIRVLGRIEAPRAVVVDVAQKGQPGLRVSARLQQSIPAQYSEYLLALALPKGEYVLRSIRDAGLAASDPTAVVANLDMPLTVAKNDTMYLGRVVIGSASLTGAEAVSIEDRFDEDVLSFRTALPELRNAKITRNVLDQRLLSSVASEQVKTNGPTLESTAINNDVAVQLTQPARGAFARYTELKLPRAFAVNPAGAYGFANGPKAVNSALQKCNERAKESGLAKDKVPPCTLFSVDNMVVTAVCSLAPAAGAARTPGSAACPPLTVTP